MSSEQKTICYFPGRESSYARNQVITSALKCAGFHVLECSGSKRNISRYLSGFSKFLKYRKQCDIVFVGFLGHFLVPLVRLFTSKPVLYDVFVSLYLTMAFDREKIAPNGLLAKIAQFFDRISCQKADHVFCDTQQHIDYFTREYGLDPQKFSRLFVGSNPALFRPVADKATTDYSDFRVHFHGEFQPLHGVDTIIRAAKSLPTINFQIIGKGQTRQSCEKLAKESALHNVEFLAPVPYQHLPKMMERASVCLGIFGDTEKAKMVIPHKVFEALAMGKAIITADTLAARELLVHGENAFLCPAADPAGLADAIKQLQTNHSLLQNIAQNGYKTFTERCAPAVLGEEIKLIVHALLKQGGGHA